MSSSTRSLPDHRLSMRLNGRPLHLVPTDLLERYRAIQEQSLVIWTEQHVLLRCLGSGGQGIVFLGEKSGADGFRLPIALKVFSPERYEDAAEYHRAMSRIGRVAARVALIQQDTLIDVHNFAALDGLRVMEMEWVDGYDLARLLSPQLLRRTRDGADEQRQAYLDDVVVTEGPVHSRLKPGIAIAVLRDALSALAALHREGLVHGDVKPSNLMLKRTGDAKLIDIGSAFVLGDPPIGRTFTPAYAAAEIFRGGDGSPLSDLASLGYVLIEMLAGLPLFADAQSRDEALDARASLIGRLPSLLPEDVTRNELLMGLIRGLVDPDPAKRFPDAEAADHFERGAASFQRQLVRSDLASEYQVEIRAWLDDLE